MLCLISIICFLLFEWSDCNQFGVATCTSTTNTPFTYIFVLSTGMKCDENLIVNSLSGKEVLPPKINCSVSPLHNVAATQCLPHFHFSEHSEFIRDISYCFSFVLRHKHLINRPCGTNFVPSRYPGRKPLM